MNISALFIRRPIGTLLLTIAIVLGGVVGFLGLSVAPLPNIDFPVIQVQAQLPGGSPATMASSVAVPLERHLQSIAGLNEITSQSSLGTTNVTLQFDLSRNIDGAARDVQAAINAARADLPTTLKSNPTYIKANPAQAPVLILALTSETRSQSQIYDAVSNLVVQKLNQVNGVGNVELGGAALPAMRIELNPQALAKYGVSLEDARAAAIATSAYRPKGVIDSHEKSYQIYTNPPTRHAEDLKGTIIAWRKGAAIRLQDIANVYDGPEDTRTLGLYNGKNAVMVLISRQPGANIIQTVDGLKAQLPELAKALPSDIHINVPSDRTLTIRASLRDVEFSLAFSILLVVLVVSLFLRTRGAMLIPAVAVIVSLAGTLGVMKLFGYSLNNLSLMGLTIATGFVVDDAIVVLENITRYVEEGMPAYKAALKGAKEVSFTVLSISLSLVAIFVPIAFAGDLMGRLFSEFALTITSAILISLVISLTTTPMLASLMLRARTPQHNGMKDDETGGVLQRFKQGQATLIALFDRGYALALASYGRCLRWALYNRGAMLCVLAGCFLITAVTITKAPKGLFPEQDTGGLMGGIRADKSISFATTVQKLTQAVDIVRHDPAVAHVVAFTGGRRAGGGFMFAILKPVSERPPARAVIGRLRPKLAHITGISLFLNPVQDLMIGGRGGNALYQYTIQGDDNQQLIEANRKMMAVFKHDAVITDVDSDYNDSAMQAYLNYDKENAQRLGITSSTIDNILYDSYGQRQIANIYSGINQYHMVMSLDPKQVTDPQSLAQVYVPEKGAVASGVSTKPVSMTMLPVISQWKLKSTDSEVNHQSAQPAITMSFSLLGTHSLSDAATEIKQVMASLNIPANIKGDFAGTAKAFGGSNNSSQWILLAALLVIYIVLGILYENLIHPITVLSSIPSALMGGMIALLVSGAQFDFIAALGMLLLIGIVKKNAIMMIDFALVAEREQGLNPREAIYEAAMKRFRPILMTTLAAGFGALPLALGSGNGAELRKPLGIVIIGGLIASQIISLLTTPVVYLALDRWRKHKDRLPHLLENQYRDTDKV
jgi:multidrug efflux pump